jgi:hypothetical protein
MQNEKKNWRQRIQNFKKIEDKECKIFLKKIEDKECKKKIEDKECKI